MHLDHLTGRWLGQGALSSTWPRPTEFWPERRTIRGAALRRRRGKRWIQLREMRATLRGFHSLSTRGPSCRCSCRTASTRLCVSVCSARHHSRQLHAPPRSHEEACVSVRYTSCLRVLHELSSAAGRHVPATPPQSDAAPFPEHRRTHVCTCGHFICPVEALAWHWRTSSCWNRPSTPSTSSKLCVLAAADRLRLSPPWDGERRERRGWTTAVGTCGSNVCEA